MDCRKAQASFWGDGNILCLHYSDGFMDVDLSTLNKLFILNMCHLLYVSYISIKLISKMLCSRSRLLTILNSTCQAINLNTFTSLTSKKSGLGSLQRTLFRTLQQVFIFALYLLQCLKPKEIHFLFKFGCVYKYHLSGLSTLNAVASWSPSALKSSNFVCLYTCADV